MSTLYSFFYLLTIFFLQVLFLNQWVTWIQYFQLSFFYEDLFEYYLFHRSRYKTFWILLAVIPCITIMTWIFAFFYKKNVCLYEWNNMKSCHKLHQNVYAEFPQVSLWFSYVSYPRNMVEDIFIHYTMVQNPDCVIIYKYIVQ